MAVSVFDLFKIGIGPSSSHTVGPMRAALMFAQGLERDGLLDATASVKVDLYGSLGATGKGHGTDRGVMLGLMGDAPDTVDPDTIVQRLEAVRVSRKLALLGTHEVPFVQKDHISFYRQALPEHPNGLKLRAFDAQGETLRESTYLSVGGGFVVTAGAPNTKVLSAVDQLPHPFRTGNELLALCESTGKSIAQLMWENERVWHTEEETRAGLLKIWDVMQSCVARGCGINNPDADGHLPGPFQVKRRAPQLYRALSGNP
ncbi:MAG TPA: serine dehydratase beta chain, partial [Paraburkholderia sp.]|nr:serine dehydratase beta chain [Paraburkholderia sp.]